MTQLSVYADFTSHPPAVLAALLSNPPLLPFPHPTLLLSCCWTNPLHPHYLHIYYITFPSSIVQLQLCIPLPVHLLQLPSHPSSISSFSFHSLSDPSRLMALFPGLFWQPSVELIHELVLGQCYHPVIVAHYQLPRAELFTAGQWPFVL